MTRIKNDGHAAAVLQYFEHDGIPVVVFPEGRYPSVVDDDDGEDVPCVQVVLHWSSIAGEILYDGWRVAAAGCYVDGRQRRLDVTAGVCAATSSPYTAIDAAQDHLDAASAVLRSIDETYERAYARIREGTRYTEPFATREEYEAACTNLGVKALADVDCYGVRHGAFSFPEYEPDHVLAMGLARLRLRALDAEKPERVAEAIIVPAKQGQLWEPCKKCGHEPVYMPLNLCERCWPNRCPLRTPAPSKGAVGPSGLH